MSYPQTKFTAIGALWNGKTKKGANCFNGGIDMDRTEDPRTTADILRAMADYADRGGKIKIGVYANPNAASHPKAPTWGITWFEPVDVNHHVGSPPGSGLDDNTGTNTPSDDDNIPF